MTEKKKMSKTISTIIGVILIIIPEPATTALGLAIVSYNILGK